jgi:hypothetical protein
MQSRFTELLVEAAGIQNEFKASFGTNPEVPGVVKTFTITDKKKPAATAAEQNGKKVGGLRRSLAAAIKNGDTAKVTEVSAQLTALGVDVAVPDALAPETPEPADVKETEPEAGDPDADEAGLDGF